MGRTEAYSGNGLRLLLGLPPLLSLPKDCARRRTAKSELGVLSTQCHDRRIPDKKTLIKEIAAWEKYRNKHHTKADWQFTTVDARITLKHLYPSI